MIRSITLFAAALCAAGAHAQVSPDTRVIESGQLSITRGDFEKMLADDPRFQLALKSPSVKLSLGKDIGKAFALEAEARRRGVDQDPAVQLKIRNYTQQLLANELLISLRKQFLKDEPRLRAEYDKTKDAYAQPRVRQILVRTPGSEVAARKGVPELSVAQARAKAEALRAQLLKGADFAALARAESDDGGSGAAGGDLGYIPKGATAAAFEAAAYALPTGRISEVVQTEFGFHVLRVDDRQPMPFDAMKPVIANELAHAYLDRLIVDGFKLNTAYFGGP